MSEVQWSRDPVRSSVATGSPNIDFLDVWDFRELLLEIVGLQFGGAPSDVLVQASPDGVNFDAVGANYLHLNAIGGNGILWGTALPITTAIGCRMHFNHWDELQETWVGVRGGRTASPTGARYTTCIYKPSLRLGGLRITNVAGANWTVNNGVYLRQRQAP